MASVAPVPESERQVAPSGEDGTQGHAATEEARPRPNRTLRQRSRRRRSRRSRARTVLQTLIFIAFAIGMWPMRLGGFSNFIVVRGASMEPHFHSGDMLYVWSADSFEVGDVAVYRIPKGQAGASNLVVHRIIGTTDEGKYLFQGDNREFRDEGEIPREDLVGAPVVNLGPLPTRGVLLAPLLLSAVIGASVTFMLWPRVPEPSLEGKNSEPDTEDQAEDDAEVPPEEDAEVPAENAPSENAPPENAPANRDQDDTVRVGAPRQLIVMEWLPELSIPEADTSPATDRSQEPSPPQSG